MGSEPIREVTIPLTKKGTGIIIPSLAAATLLSLGYLFFGKPDSALAIACGFNAALFGLLTIILIIEFLPGMACLKLDGDGLTIVYWFQEVSHNWSDIEAIRLVDVRGTQNKVVVLTFRDGYRLKSNKGLEYAWVSGTPDEVNRRSRYLGRNYEVGGEELVALMNTYKDNADCAG